MISIIMSVYKEKATILERAIDSIINQSYKNWEFIIVLDNPENTELKKVILGRMKICNRIIFIENEYNIGLPASLNKAIKVSQGDYIARMDADDISLSKRLEEQLFYLKKYELDCVGCNMEIFNEANVGVNRVTEYPISFRSIKEIIKFDTCIPHPTWVIRKEVYKKLRGYRNVHTCEDYDFLTRVIINKFRVGNCPSVLYRYSYNNESISRSNAAKQQLIRQYISKCYKKNSICKLEDIEIYLNSARGIKELRIISEYYNTRNIILHKNSIFKCLLATIKLMTNKYLYSRRINSWRFKFIVKKDKKYVYDK